MLTGARANYEQVKAVGVGQDASFSGPGQLECYGAMRVYDLAGSGDAECFPGKYTSRCNWILKLPT